MLAAELSEAALSRKPHITAAVGNKSEGEWISRRKAEGRKPAQPSIPEGILGFPSL
jgi:hypothetical protein